MSVQVRADELVRAALHTLGVGANQPTEFARRLGLTGDFRNKRTKRWISGSNAPDYEGTMAILQALGVIDEQKLNEALRQGARAEASGAVQLSKEAQATLRPVRRGRSRRAPGSH